MPEGSPSLGLGGALFRFVAAAISFAHSTVRLRGVDDRIMGSHRSNMVIWPGARALEDGHRSRRPVPTALQDFDPLPVQLNYYRVTRPRRNSLGEIGADPYPDHSKNSL